MFLRILKSLLLLFLLLLQKWILSYLSGVWKYIFIQAIIFVVMGIMILLQKPVIASIFYDI